MHIWKTVAVATLLTSIRHRTNLKNISTNDKFLHDSQQSTNYWTFFWNISGNLWFLFSISLFFFFIFFCEFFIQSFPFFLHFFLHFFIYFLLFPNTLTNYQFIQTLSTFLEFENYWKFYFAFVKSLLWLKRRNRIFIALASWSKVFDTKYFQTKCLFFQLYNKTAPKSLEFFLKEIYLQFLLL